MNEGSTSFFFVLINNIIHATCRLDLQKECELLKVEKKVVKERKDHFYTLTPF